MKRKKVKTIDISKPIQVTNENLGSIFKSLRMEKDYTQEALALDLGVSSLTVRKWEWDVAKPPIPYFLNLLDFYGYKLMLVKSRKTETINADGLYDLFCGMSETMQQSIIEIMKVTQDKKEDKND